MMDVAAPTLKRPGIKAMLEMVRRREIDCVIVKDFSRFGRNYVEVGNYLEQVFPFLGVRFISVNDGYDSKDYPYGVAGDINNGLRNLINELYSRDLSQKVKDSYRQYTNVVNAFLPTPFTAMLNHRRTAGC